MRARKSKRVRWEYHGNNCAPIAISAATGLPYHEVYKVCRDHGFKNAGMRMPQVSRVLQDLRVSVDWVPLMSLLGEPLVDFASAVDRDQSYIVVIPGHMVAVNKGRIMDLADARRSSPVLFYGRLVRKKHDVGRNKFIATVEQSCRIIAFFRSLRRELWFEWRKHKRKSKIQQAPSPVGKDD